jgi:predicted MPP superfamily phosphohydrolase
LGLTGIAGFTYARTMEPRWIDIEQVDLQVPGLPEKLGGKRIVHLSDIHLSDFVGPEQLAEAVTLINRLAPDWLFLTGDYVSDMATAAAGLVEPLRRVEAPIYAVYGNHDYWADLHLVTSMLEAAGVHILRNTATPLAEGLWLAGVDDLCGGRPDLEGALRSVPDGVTTLLLVHEPDFFDRVLYRQAPIAVQFSGHSHGGQIRLPTLRPGTDGLYTYAPLLPKYGQRYPIGLRRVGNRQVYTNRGLGVWPLPYRINCRPEITSFTLRPSAGAFLQV